MTNHENNNHGTEPTSERTTTTPEGHEHDDHPRPHIWIASLADYNNGRLHGAWVDAGLDPEELEQAAWRILATSPEPDAEEWAIHDYDGFGPLRLGENEALEDISAIAKGIARHGPAFAAWAEMVWDGQPSLDHDLLDQFDEHYMGHHATLAAWAEEMCDDLGFTLEAGGHLPATLQPYVHIDYQALGRDMEIEGDVTSVEVEGGGVWVFRGL